MLAGGTGGAGAVDEVLLTQVALITPVGPYGPRAEVYAVLGVSPVALKVPIPLAHRGLFHAIEEDLDMVEVCRGTGSVQFQVIYVGWYVVLWRFVTLSGGTGAVIAVLVTQVALMNPTGPSVFILRVYAVEGVSPVFSEGLNSFGHIGLEHIVEEDSGIRCSLTRWDQSSSR